MTEVYCVSVLWGEDSNIAEYLLRMPDGEYKRILKETLRARVNLGILDVVNMELTPEGNFKFISKEINYNFSVEGVGIIDDELYIGDDIVSIDLSPYSIKQSMKLFGLNRTMKRFIVETVNGDFGIFDCDVAKLKAIHFGCNLAQIGTMTFENSYKLEKLIIPDSVSSISVAAFCGCKNLKSVYIPDSVVYLGSSAFGWCKKLTEVHMPRNPKYTELGAEMFMRCKNLKELIIPKNVNSIGEDAFYKCPQLNLVYEDRLGILEWDENRFKIIY